jgi:hypothetical protein
LFGSILRLDDDDEDKPKPPVPPLGKTIYPIEVRRPLPLPIPAPSVPELEVVAPSDVSDSPTQSLVALSDEADQNDPKNVLRVIEVPSKIKAPSDEKLSAIPQLPEFAANTHMLQIRDAIRSTLAQYRRPLSLRSASPADVMQACWGWGSAAELGGDNRNSRPINAIGALCWNVPCAGKTLLVVSDGKIMPRIGYGFQSKRGELLATLAMAAVSSENEIRIGATRGTVLDLVDWEKTSVRRGTDLSMTLIGLANYLGPDATWNNAAGEDWSLDIIAAEELIRTAPVTDVAAVERLMGLSAYVVWARKHDVPRSGRHLQVEQYVARFHEHALKLQSNEGTWGPHFFGYQASGGIDSRGSLGSTSSVLLWLTLSLSDEQLQRPEIARAAAQVNNGLAAQLKRQPIDTLSPQELSMTMVGLRAISEYDRRLFGFSEEHAESD